MAAKTNNLKNSIIYNGAQYTGIWGHQFHFLSLTLSDIHIRHC